MPAHFDHLILAANDAQQGIDFYTRTLGFRVRGERPPFSTVRVTPDFVSQLASWRTKGGEHLRLRCRGEFGDVFEGSTVIVSRCERGHAARVARPTG